MVDVPDEIRSKNQPYTNHKRLHLHPLVWRKWKRAYQTKETKDLLHKKTAVVCSMTPRSLVNMYRCLGGTSYLYHQGRREHP